MHLIKTAGMLVGALFMLVGCEEKESSWSVVGTAGLPFAADAAPFDAEGFTEVVLEEGKWKAFSKGVEIERGELIENLKMGKEVTDNEEIEPRLLVSAAAETRFKKVVEAVREGLSSGYRCVDFLVERKGESNQAVHLEIPFAEGVQPDIEPKFIRIKADGAVSIGAGNAEVELDRVVGERSLPLLCADLQSYHDAAAAAMTAPICRIYVDGACSYQRAIDVLVCARGVGIERIIVANWSDDVVTTCGGMNFQTIERTMSLPVAPSRR